MCGEECGLSVKPAPTLSAETLRTPLLAPHLAMPADSPFAAVLLAVGFGREGGVDGWTTCAGVKAILAVAVFLSLCLKYKFLFILLMLSAPTLR